MAKRDREKARQQKQREKEEQRSQRKANKRERRYTREGEDPDLAGLTWGPQPPLYWGRSHVDRYPTDAEGFSTQFGPLSQWAGHSTYALHLGCRTVS